MLSSSAEPSRSAAGEGDVMGLSEGNELLDPRLRDHGVEGLKDAGEVVVRITDRGVQAG